MNGLTIKLDSEQIQWVQGQAKARGCSKAAVVREIIDERRNDRGKGSLHDRMRDLCGTLSGSPDLSTRKLKGYGRD